MEQKVVDQFSENGRRKVVIIRQEDGAGPHNDKCYLRRMKRSFQKRDWLLFNQPSQSPVTNVHDACIFPMMSKAVSKEQAVTFGSTLLKGEQLHNTVNKVWHDERNKLAMARAFAGHHQIVTSIMKHKGDNNYLSEKGGLSFGMWKVFIRNEEGGGVQLITLAAEREDQTLQGQILRQQRQLKYEKPAVAELQRASLTKEMREILLEHMDPHKMSDDLHSAWYQLTGG